MPIYNRMDIFAAALLFVWMLNQIPPPTPEDVCLLARQNAYRCAALSDGTFSGNLLWTLP